MAYKWGPVKWMLHLIPVIIMASGAVDYAPPRRTRPLTPGIIAPLPTFFLPKSEDLGVHFRIALMFCCGDAPEERRFGGA